MKQLITSDKVQKELLTDFMIMGETRGLIGGYCENEFPVYYANEEYCISNNTKMEGWRHNN